MPVRAVDDKPSDTLVVVSDEGFWTGSSTLPHLHQLPRPAARDAGAAAAPKDMAQHEWSLHGQRAPFGDRGLSRARAVWRPERPSRRRVTDSHARAKMSGAGAKTRRRPTTYEHLMTDLPDSAADRAANAHS
jgi:hypothetical protein